MSFDLKKYLAEGKLYEAYNISAEVKVGDIFTNNEAEQYEVSSVSDSHVELKPKTFDGENTIFPEDFGDDVSIEDFWQHFEKVEDEPRGPFGEPEDSIFLGNHIREEDDDGSYTTHCDICDMDSTYSDDTPYGTCMCS